MTQFMRIGSDPMVTSYSMFRHSVSTKSDSKSEAAFQKEKSYMQKIA